MFPRASATPPPAGRMFLARIGTSPPTGGNSPLTRGTAPREGTPPLKRGDNRSPVGAGLVAQPLMQNAVEIADAAGLRQGGELIQREDRTPLPAGLGRRLYDLGRNQPAPTHEFLVAVLVIVEEHGARGEWGYGP